MSDRNVKLFILFAGFYFISKDISAVVVYSRKQRTEKPKTKICNQTLKVEENEKKNFYAYNLNCP